MDNLYDFIRDRDRDAASYAQQQDQYAKSNQTVNPKLANAPPSTILFAANSAIASLDGWTNSYGEPMTIADKMLALRTAMFVLAEQP